jgi:hypothetical protein
VGLPNVNDDVIYNQTQKQKQKQAARSNSDDIPEPEVEGVDEDNLHGNDDEDEEDPPDGFTTVTMTKEDFASQLQLCMKSKKQHDQSTSTSTTSPQPPTTTTPPSVSASSVAAPNETVVVDGPSDGRPDVFTDLCPFCGKAGHKTRRAKSCLKHSAWEAEQVGQGAPANGLGSEPTVAVGSEKTVIVGGPSDGHPQPANVCPFCGKAGHKTRRAKSCLENSAWESEQVGQGRAKRQKTNT